MKRVIIVFLFLILLSCLANAQAMMQESRWIFNSKDDMRLEFVLELQDKELSDSYKSAILVNKTFFEDNYKRSLEASLSDIKIDYENLNTPNLLKIKINANAGKKFEQVGNRYKFSQAVSAKAQDNFTKKVIEVLYIPITAQVTSITLKPDEISASGNYKVYKWVANEGEEKDISIEFSLETTPLASTESFLTGSGINLLAEGSMVFFAGAAVVVFIGLIFVIVFKRRRF